ncbi:MAG TPA: hypothetical protein VLI72_01755 [Methylibium sp.]|nr:hypothetical protein [Methylibium sp.]
MSRSPLARASIAVALWLCAAAQAQQLTPSSFRYTGGPTTKLAGGDVVAAWNVRDPKSTLRPGLKVLFFGSSPLCDPDAEHGPVTSKGNVRTEQAKSVTGLELDPQGSLWTPSGDTDQCSPAARGKAGDSFMHVNAAPGGGVGMFTYTGRDVGGREPFFEQHGRGGKEGTGANANIGGSFFFWSLDWRGKEVVRPWSGGGSAQGATAELRTTQSVARATVPPKGGAKKGENVQAKQQVIFTVINEDCVKGGSDAKTCRLKYLFNLAVFRAGVADVRNEPWFKEGSVFFDPAQAGVAIIHGPIPAAGQTLRDRHTDASLYTSAGEPSQGQEFTDKRFVVRISFEQLTNALRTIASRRTGKTFDAVRDADVAALFGPRWNDPAQWVLTSINVSQEVFNYQREQRAFIGGNFRELQFGS